MRSILIGIFFIFSCSFVLGQKSPLGLLDSTLVDSAKTLSRQSMFKEAILVWERIIANELSHKDSFDLSLAECYHQLGINHFKRADQLNSILYCSLSRKIWKKETPDARCFYGHQYTLL